MDEKKHIDAWSTWETKTHKNVALAGFMDARWILTSPIVAIAGRVVTTRSGSRYTLGLHAYGPKQEDADFAKIRAHIQKVGARR